MEVGARVLIAAVEYLKARPQPRPLLPEPLTVFIIRTLKLHKAGPRSFPQQTCIDPAVYKFMGMFRVTETCKVSYPAVVGPPGSGIATTYNKRYSSPLRLEITHPDGSTELIDLREHTAANRRLWMDTTVTKHSQRARSEVGTTEAYGDLISFQSSYFSDDLFAKAEANIWGAGNQSPAGRLCTGHSQETFRQLMGNNWWTIMPQAPPAHKQLPKADFDPGEEKRPVNTIAEQLLHDINCNLLPVRDIGHRELVHCLHCDYSADNLPDRDPSAITSVRPDGSGAVGYWCFNCLSPSHPRQGVMYWFDVEQQVIDPLEGERPFRQHGQPDQFLAHVVQPHEVLSTRICGIAAQTGAGKTVFWQRLLDYHDGLAQWNPATSPSPMAGEVFKLNGITPWLVIVFRRSLAEFFYSCLMDKGETAHQQLLINFQVAQYGL